MANARTRRKWRRRWLLLIPCLTAGIWLISSAVSYAAHLRLYAIPTASMSPTLAPGDRIAVETQPGLTPKRGEVWVFDVRPNMTLAKRVVGLPGETIEVSGGRVLIDGQPLREPYLAAPISYTMPPVRLRADEYFMLGDNRDASNDSHVWGALPRAQFVGRAEYRCWPTKRVGGLR